MYSLDLLKPKMQEKRLTYVIGDKTDMVIRDNQKGKLECNHIPHKGKLIGASVSSTLASWIVNLTYTVLTQNYVPLPLFAD